MISLSLDRHDFVSAVEGFAHGSHLRQHVWREIVFRNIPQMTDDDMDFFWYIFRRNLWDCYFRLRDGKMVCEYGSEDYLHALAALHRGNHYTILFQSPDMKGQYEVTAYRFNGLYRPLFQPHLATFTFTSKYIARFTSYIPDEWIQKKEKIHFFMPNNKFVPDGRKSWWTDLDVYEKLPSDNQQTS